MLPDWKAAANLVKTIAENYKLPYYTLSPTYSICREHGYLAGEQKVCPHCGLGNWKYQAAEKTLELGTMLKSRYKIGTVIGDGGFGITYRAVDMNTGKGVAVKEFYPREVVARSSISTSTSSTETE